MGGDVGEGQQGRDVAGGVDPPRARAQPIVDDHGAALVGGHAGGVQADPGAARPPPRGDEDAVERDGRLAVGAAEEDLRGSVGRAAQLDRPRLQPHVDPVRGQGLGDQGAGVGLLLEQQPVGELDDRHLRSQPREGLSELAADGPAAEHDQAARQLAQLPHRLGGQDVVAIQA